MRFIGPKEKKQRGCLYCADMCILKGHKRFNGASRHYCPYDVCPYAELDSVKSYNEYMNKFDVDTDGVVEALMDILDPTHKKQVL